MIGTVLGEYQIVKLIGQGGMGAVYEALQGKIGRRVALKLLLPEFANNPAVIERFFNEARAVNAINHPGIVQVSDLGSTDSGGAYLVMEYLEGETLGGRLHRLGMRLSEEDTVRIGWQIAGTLSAAHNKGIVHRDIKPANIMIVPDPAGPGGERVKVLDFGIAKLATAASHTKAGQIMGTVTYMSPEQIRTPAEVDGQSDVYSLGAVLYYLLTGRPPFSSKSSDLVVLTMHLSQAPQPIESLVPGLTPAMASLVMRMLNKPPGERPLMSEVAEQLLSFDSGASTHAVRRVSRTAIPVLTPLPQESTQPQSSVPDVLTASTLAHGAGQSVRKKAPWRRALPALCALLLIAGTVVAVSSLRPPSSPLSGAQDAASKRPPTAPNAADSPPPSASGRAEQIRPTGKTLPTADAKAARTGKFSKTRGLDARAASADKSRKKNAAPAGKTTPLIH